MGVCPPEESYYCDFGLNPAYQEALNTAGLIVTGSDLQQETRIMEIASHPFYVATLFVPQSRSVEGRPHPLVLAFARAVLVASR